MSKQKQPKMGRPLIGKQAKVRMTVMIEPSVAEYLRKLGDGNLSGGIAEAASNAKLVRRIAR